jgi:hypothetical protein
MDARVFLANAARRATARAEQRMTERDDREIELGPRPPAETFLTCFFCDQPARFVLTCLGKRGLISRMVRLAEATCGRTHCPGPGNHGAHYRSWKDPSWGHSRKHVEGRYEGYIDVMLRFIRCDANNEPETFENGGRWTWHTPEVWVRWLAATRVRGRLRHAPPNQ